MFDKYGIPNFSNQLEESKIDSLLANFSTAKNKLKLRQIGFDVFRKAANDVENYGEKIRQMLPFSTTVAYASRPIESAISAGGYHIVRMSGQTLCGVNKYHLESKPGHDPSCAKCIRTAENVLKEKGTVDPVEDFLVPVAAPLPDEENFNKETGDDQKDIDGNF